MFPGDQFTYTELEEAALVYRHDGSVGLFDTLQLSVRDGLHSSLASVDIAVTKVDKHSPYKLPYTTCHLDITEGRWPGLGKTGSFVPATKIWSNLSLDMS